MASSYEMSETGNWNIAQNWTNDMIFRPFFEASLYLQIAKFGFLDIEEDFLMDDNSKINSRIKALPLARNKIEMGIRNSCFAIRNTKDKEKMQEFLKDVVSLDKNMEFIKDKVVDRDVYKIIINEEMFKLIYDVLIRIYTEVTEPMNRNDLIFNYKEQFDPHEFKKNIKERFVEGG